MSDRTVSVWTSALLVAFMHVTLAWSIESADWVPGLTILTAIVVGGVALGAVLSRLHWLPVLVAHGWSIVIGFGTTLWLGSRVLPLFDSIDPDWFAGASTYARMGLVRDWYIGWLRVAATESLDGSPLQYDMSRLFAVVTLALLLWLLSYISAWFAIRYISWAGATLPSGFALLFNLYQSQRGDDLIYLGFFALCALLLAARTNLALRMETWRRDRIQHNLDLEFDFLRDGLVIALLVIGMAIILPDRARAEAFRTLTQRWSSVSERAQSISERYFPNIDYSQRGGGNRFGDSMPLTGAIDLASGPVFDATIESISGELPRYFRMAVYDTYDGSGWRRTAEGRESGGPSELDLSPDWALTIPVTQTMRTLRGDVQQLYAAPQPDRFALDIEAEVAGGGQDVLTIESRVPLEAGESYTVVSRLPVADETSLREAGAREDPDWVRDRYLGVPDTVPSRVLELAAEITAGAESRYDAARALEAWLRANITYKEQIPSPPSDRDRVDWVLFDQREGYCDYYSSSFVVMARAIGIPSRVSAGYNRGELQPESGAYRQRDDDAHTWPEVFFPGLGWVEFEPTASEAIVSRPGTPDEVAEAFEDEELAMPQQPDRADMLPDDEMLDDFEVPDRPEFQEPERSIAQRAAPRWLIGLLVAFVGAIAMAHHFVWRKPLSGLSVVESAFARVVRIASWFGLRPSRSETPNEFGARLSGAIPEARPEITTITRAFVAERFGRRRDDDAGRIEAAWTHARWAITRGLARVGLHRLRRR